jgi:hypothetical protein
MLMRTQRWTLAVVLPLLIFLCVANLVHERKRVASSDPAPRTQQPAAQHAQVRVVAREQQEQEQQHAALMLLAEAQDSPTTPTGSREVGGAGGTLTPPAVEHSQLVARWEAEAPDSPWTQTVSSLLQTSFSDLHIQGNVADVSCRRTLCRAELEFDEASEAQRYSAETGPTDAHIWLNPGSGRPGMSVEVFVSK